MLTLPDFNRLHVFYCAYRHKSILKAAEELHVTRSAVSQSIKALELELRTTLFIRTNKTVTPTRAADRLCETIDPFVQNLSSTLNFLEKGRAEPAGTLRIGAPLEFGSRHLTEVIAKFRQKHPSVNFEVILAIPVKLLSLVSEGGLDIAFVDNGDIFQKKYPVKLKTVAQEDFVLIASQKYYRRHLSSNQTYQRLVECDFVDYVNHGAVVKMWFKHHFKKSPLELKIALSIESVHGIVNAVQGSMGMGIVPSYIVQNQIKSGMVKVIETGKSEWINKITLAYMEGKGLSLTEKAFVDFYLANSGRDGTL
jgi:DNA-binding transcriptional LysR family regulator